MNKIVFLTSPYLRRPNVLSKLDLHYSRGRYVVDDLEFSQDIAICEGVHIADEKVLQAVVKRIRKDCKVCVIMCANEETQEFEEVI